MTSALKYYNVLHATMKDLLTTNQLAEYLQLKPVTIRRKAAKGEIPALKIGRQIRFDKAQIDKWLLLGNMRKSAQILVVDDEPLVVDLIRATLEEEGYQVTTTSSSLEAAGIITEKRFSLIFLDLLMPNLDGSELFKRIRDIDQSVPVVIITGYPDSKVLEKAIKYAPFTVITKPFDCNQILNTIPIALPWVHGTK